MRRVLSCPAQSCLDEETHFYEPSAIRSEFFVQTYEERLSKKWGLFAESTGSTSKNWTPENATGLPGRAGFQAVPASRAKAIQ
jgi:hypothetical protein